MNPQTRAWIIQGAIGVAVGLAVAFAIGWWLWPVEYTNTPPSVLRRDYCDEYVVMIATTYTVEGDVIRAHERLTTLDPENPTALVVELGERMIETGGDPQDIARLAHLARALNVITPPLRPYLESQP